MSNGAMHNGGKKSREKFRKDGREIAICHSFMVDTEIIIASTTECLWCARNCSGFPCVSSFNSYTTTGSVCDAKPCSPEQEMKAPGSYATRCHAAAERYSQPS